jgi:hypothetical protein
LLCLRRREAALLPWEAVPDLGARRFTAPPQARSFADLRAESRAVRVATEATREAIAAMDSEPGRDEVRAILESELEQRHVRKSPYWIEGTIDQIITPATLTEQIAAVGKLARAAFAVVKIFRGAELPGTEPPSWLAPPARAAYAAGGGPVAKNAIAVSLDPDSAGYLDEVLHALPELSGVRFSCRAWLDTDGGDLVVHLGEGRVGVIPAAHRADYVNLMAAAAQLDELPHLPASLHRISTGFLLELGRP